MKGVFYMKRIISFLLLLALFMSVWGHLNISVFATDVTETTTPESTVPATTEQDTTEPETTEPEEGVTVPAVENMDALSAISIISDAGLYINSETIVTNKVKLDGKVQKTIPSAGTIVEKGTVVTVYVYKYVEPEKPKMPQNVTAKQVVGGIKISWSAVENAVSYNIYRTVFNSDSWKLLEKNITGLSFVDTKARMGSKYAYAVEACSEEAKSGYDKNKKVFMERLDTPKIKAVENSVDGVKLSWKSIKNANAYEVFRRESGGAWKRIKRTKLYYCFDKTAVSGKRYEYGIRAFNNITKSERYETGQSIKYLAVPEKRPLKTIDDGFKISWKAVPGAKKYEIYRYVQRYGGEWKLLTTVKNTTYTDKTVIPYMGYKYSIVAVNGDRSALNKKASFEKFIPVGKWDKELAYRFYEDKISWPNPSTPGYTIKSWQKVDSSRTTGKNSEFVNTFNSAMAQSFYPSSSPFKKRCKIYSRDCKDFLPPCDVKLSNIKSFTVTEEDDYITVKFVMKDEISPEKNKGGIKDMSLNYFDLNGTVKELKKQGLITKGYSSSTYKNFTITAKIKKNGKIVSMEHKCENIVMSMNMNFINGIGNVKYNAQVDSYLTYTNFKY